MARMYTGDIPFGSPIIAARPEVLDRANGCMMEGHLQIAIPVARAPVARLAARVVRAGHQAAVRMKVAHTREALDVVDL